MTKIRKLLFIGVMSLIMTGCSTDEVTINLRKTEIQDLESNIAELESQKQNLEQVVKDLKIEKGLEKYVVTINISQSHISLDIGKHIKNAMNDIDIQVPVDKEFYESVEVGTVLDDSFRVGSLIMYGSFGKWKVKITGKEVM